MSVNKMLSLAALAVAAVAAVIATITLLHELTTGADPHSVMHSLENWVTGVGYHLALIALAATAVNYLASKK